MDIERPKSKQPLPDHAKKVFSGVIFDVYHWEQKMFDGSTATFEKLKRPDTVIVFPVLPNGRIILTEQEQPGKKPFIGAAGGRLDPGETILEAAERELLEETGYKANHYTLWHSEQPTSKIEWAVYIFIAKKVEKIAEANPDAGEKIILKQVMFDEFLDIGVQENFYEKEIVPLLYQAMLDKDKKEKLRKLFDPNI